MRYRVCVAEVFSAAHSIGSHGGVGRHLHGHDFRARVCATAETLGGGNVAVDLEVLESALRRVLEGLDHRYLNEVLGVEDLSMEYLARYLLERLRERVAEVDAVEVCAGEGKYCVEVLSERPGGARPDAERS